MIFFWLKYRRLAKMHSCSLLEHSVRQIGKEAAQDSVKLENDQLKKRIDQLEEALINCEKRNRITIYECMAGQSRR